MDLYQKTATPLVDVSEHSRRELRCLVLYSPSQAQLATRSSEITLLLKKVFSILAKFDIFEETLREAAKAHAEERERRDTNLIG